MGLARIKGNIDKLAKTRNIANQTLWDMFFFENFFAIIFSIFIKTILNISLNNQTIYRIDY